MATDVLIYGTILGGGGLGVHAASSLKSMSMLGTAVSAIGPGLDGLHVGELQDNVSLVISKPRRIRARYFKGVAQYRRDRDFGTKAAGYLDSLAPDRCCGFTQVSRESALWCAKKDIPFLLDNPNGHIRNFQEVCNRESWRWCAVPFLGHPTNSMVRRVEEEYGLATRIRVSSSFSKRTMVELGVPAEKIDVIHQSIDLQRFARPPSRPQLKRGTPLRLCFVGSLDLRKGFVYLLRAVRKFKQEIQLRIVGATGDPWCRRLFAREADGLDIEVLPGNPVPSYHWAELSILPSLEDGFGLVVAEAMAAGLPVIASDQCGAAEWIQHGVSGWVVPFREAQAKHNRTENLEEALAHYLRVALANRQNLEGMGVAARQSALRLGHENNSLHLADWLRSTRVCPS